VCSAHFLHALCWSCCSGLLIIGDCRSLLKFVILQRSGDRLLTEGGMTSGDGLAGVAGSSLQTSPEMRAQAKALLPCDCMQQVTLPQIVTLHKIGAVMSYFACAGASTTMLQSHQHGTPFKLLLLFALEGTYKLSPLVIPEVTLACIGRHLYCATLQAVYGAFARFRAHHCLGAPQQQQPSPAAISEGEATAIRMLQHVSDTAAAAPPTTEGETTGTLSDPELQQAGHSGMRSIPSQQSDLPSLASTQAEQGSADRQAMLTILSLLPALLCTGVPLCANCATTHCHL